jgi:hypothetical protein
MLLWDMDRYADAGGFGPGRRGRGGPPIRTVHFWGEKCWEMMNLEKIETYRNPFEKGKGRDIETSSCGSTWLGHGWATRAPSASLNLRDGAGEKERERGIVTVFFEFGVYLHGRQCLKNFTSHIRSANPGCSASVSLRRLLRKKVRKSRTPFLSWPFEDFWCWWKHVKAYGNSMQQKNHGAIHISYSYVMYAGYQWMSSDIMSWFCLLTMFLGKGVGQESPPAGGPRAWHWRFHWPLWHQREVRHRIWN